VGGVHTIEDDLGDTGAVAQIDEDNVPEVVAPVDPSHQRGLFARFGEAESAAHVSSPEIA
jgi:hypothetical protein